MSSNKFCAPHIQSGAGSSYCFKREHLVKIGKAYNKSAKGKKSPINIKLNKDALWKSIKKHLERWCKFEWCWSSLDFILNNLGEEDLKILGNVHLPEGPHDNTWLSTVNINGTMEQYEDKYKDFKFYGPFPINFYEIYYDLLGNIDLKTLYNNGTKRLGFIFNLDPSYKKGSHWVSLFVDMRKNKRVIGFYDSRGRCPPPPEIKKFMLNLADQADNIFKTDGSSEKTFELKCSTYQHQRENSECGVYSMYFIIQSLKGKSFENIERNIILDDEMNRFRKQLYRPIDKQ